MRNKVAGELPYKWKSCKPYAVRVYELFIMIQYPPNT